MHSGHFLVIVPHHQQARMRRSTLELWCHIYAYIELQGFADTVDDLEFKECIEGYKQKDVPNSTVMAHLRRMAECGLLTGHHLRVRGRVDLLGAMMGSRSPTHMVRYTLHDRECPLRSKTSEDSQRATAASKQVKEEEEREGPKEVRTLDDVSKLLRWLEEKRQERLVITSEQSERLNKLVADASGILRTTDANIQKLYIGAAMRSNLDPGV